MLRKLISLTRDYYDKVLAVSVFTLLLISLIYLVIRVGMFRTVQERFDEEMRLKVPLHPETLRVDPSILGSARERLTHPFQIHAWSNGLVVPELRVWCIDCIRPIPFDAERCPFCDAKQPKDPEQLDDYDGDKDLMPDVWEKANGLDARDPLDAAQDSDGDGWTNVEEYNANPKTSPHDPLSHPPAATKLVLMDIRTESFKLRFRSVAKSEGSLSVGLNLGADRTYFLKVGDVVGSFKLISYEEKIRKKDNPAINSVIREDVSEVVLERGDKRIVLIKDRDVPYRESTAIVVYKVDGRQFELKVGAELVLLNDTMRVKAIDTSRETVVLRRDSDGAEFEVSKGNSVFSSVPEKSQSIRE